MEKTAFKQNLMIHQKKEKKRKNEMAQDLWWIKVYDDSGKFHLCENLLAYFNRGSFTRSHTELLISNSASFFTFLLFFYRGNHLMALAIFLRDQTIQTMRLLMAVSCEPVALTLLSKQLFFLLQARVQWTKFSRNFQSQKFNKLIVIAL